jgi:hypothetical protein
MTAVYCAILHHFLINSQDKMRWEAQKENKGRKIRSKKKT